MGNLFFDEPGVKPAKLALEVGDVIRWMSQPGMWYRVDTIQNRGDMVGNMELRLVIVKTNDFHYPVGFVIPNHFLATTTMFNVMEIVSMEEVLRG